ncbi:hypothetical protein HYU21_02875 [Candidatus Woesearchaeota archaeon]|nr:hypothetical protein [Candidatus Woesearchaeota archaeon]
MKSYYTNNIEEAHNILHERFEMIMICDNFYQKNINIANVGNLIYNTKSLIVTIHTIGRIVYQGMPG